MPWITAQEWTDFGTCRRRWEFSSPFRRNLEPAARLRICDLERAVKEALAVYYFPGMWDWPRAVVLPLVTKGFERAVAEQRAAIDADRRLSRAEGVAWAESIDAGLRILDTYMAQAPALDHFAPVLTDTEFAAPVPDPAPHGADSSRGLVTHDGQGVTYIGRVDVLVVDVYDSYWIMRHRLVDQWTPIDELVTDQRSSAACWAWAGYYLGMTITGTVDNELRVDPPSAATGTGPPEPRATRVAQSEGSGGGRSIPQHRRLSAQGMEPAELPRVEIQQAPGTRRAWIRRRPHDTDVVAADLAADLRRMIDPATPTPPNPSRDLCARCAFLRPCLETSYGCLPEDALRDGYRVKRPESPKVTWSTGRGAAPPTFRRAGRPEG